MPDPSSPRIVDVETLRDPHKYAPDQIRRAYDVAVQLNRGKLVLCQEPREHA